MRRALEYIAAGDIFQVNLSQRFTAVGRPEPLDLYLRLKAVSPAPFSAFLQWDDLAVVSASPEWFFQTRGDHIITRPIKGTRPRGRTPQDDARLIEELRASSKDRAELNMIVDLERNDLGRICRYGSIRVDEPLDDRELRPGPPPGRHRCRPPPRRVWPHRRRPGPLPRRLDHRRAEDPRHADHRRARADRAVASTPVRSATSAATAPSAFNIAIRTMLVEGDRVCYQVGGGIVADSDPEAEYRETLHKGEGLRAVLEGAGVGRQRC